MPACHASHIRKNCGLRLVRLDAWGTSGAQGAQERSRLTGRTAQMTARQHNCNEPSSGFGSEFRWFQYASPPLLSVSTRVCPFGCLSTLLICYRSCKTHFFYHARAQHISFYHLTPCVCWTRYVYSLPTHREHRDRPIPERSSITRSATYRISFIHDKNAVSLGVLRVALGLLGHARDTCTYICNSWV